MKGNGLSLLLIRLCRIGWNYVGVFPSGFWAGRCLDFGSDEVMSRCKGSSGFGRRESSRMLMLTILDSVYVKRSAAFVFSNL